MPEWPADQEARLVVIPVARDLFGYVRTKPAKNHKKTPLIGIDKDIYVSSPFAGDQINSYTYNMPFLFRENGEPWWEANSYLMHLVQYKHPVKRPTDEARRRAGRLLDYARFCEKEGIDWLDFSARRPSQRPTYRYFISLVDQGSRSAAVINQYTGAVYDFYKYVCALCHKHIDLDRVDKTFDMTIYYESRTGSRSKQVTKRSQTKATPGISEVPMGYIREDGEDLRPLTTPQMKLLLTDITTPYWGVQERLILKCALYTGARKQSVLTLRMKHLKAFNDNNMNKDGTYTLHAGPGTGIDTKNHKKQQLYVPMQLAEDLMVWAMSPSAKRHRKKFTIKYESEFPELPTFDEDQIYIFLSDQGGAYYMAKNDPRYPAVKSPPIGQVTDTLKRKIHRRLESEKFPGDFSFHWLRATFAYQYYLWLQPWVDEGRITASEQLVMVKERLHHESVETTQNYLKLFANINERMEAQEKWEDRVFGDFMGVDDGD